MQSESGRADLSVPIEERFTLEARLAYSLSGQVFKAIDRVSRSSVAIWVSRRPLSVEAAELFLRRAETMRGMAGQPEVTAYGLDPMRNGWVVFRLFAGRHILEGRVDRREAERRWLGCVRAIERFHKAGISCGDVCLESFLLTSSGDVRFLGGLGMFPPDSDTLLGALSAESGELSMYLAPEQVEDGSSSMSADVYALARLSYRLFSGKLLTESARPTSGQAQAQLPSLERAPGWFNLAITPIFSCLPEDRPQDAMALMQAILRERTEVSAEAFSKSSDPANAPDSINVALGNPQPARSQTLRAAVIAVMAVLCGILLSLSVLRPGGLLRMVGWGSAAVVSQEKLQALGSSDDPMTHESLLRLVAASGEPAEINQLFDVVLTRARRLGLSRSSDLVRAWLQRENHSPLMTGKPPLALKALNPAISEGAREELIQRAYQSDAQAATQLAAALALDLRNVELFRAVYSNAVKDLGRSAVPDEQSTTAIMLAAAPVRSLFLSEILESKELSAADTVWLLERLREQGESNLQPVVRQGLRNGTFVGPRRVFAEALIDPTALSTRDRIVFVACLLGEPSRASAVALASSYNPHTARALLALVWLSDNADVRAAAIDGLLAKPLGDPNAQRIADYVKSKKPEERGRYHKIIAAAGLSDLLSDAEFSSAFAPLRQGAPEPDLLAAVLQSAPPRVVFEVIAASGGTLQVNVYLDLLKHPSKDVRLEALKKLRGFNDATMFALVRQMYDEEQDEEVRAEYRAFLSS